MLYHYCLVKISCRICVNKWCYIAEATVKYSMFLVMYSLYIYVRKVCHLPIHINLLSFLGPCILIISGPDLCRGLFPR